MSTVTEFGYHIRDTVERRRVRKPEFVNEHGRWYMRGYDLDRKGERTFRCDKVVSASAATDPPGASDPIVYWVGRKGEVKMSGARPTTVVFDEA